jgi:cell division septal protein FtsQ
MLQISGLERLKPGLVAGQENEAEPLRLALRVVRLLRQAPPLAARRIIQVDASDPRQITFTMQDGAQVRCGSEAELASHLERLEAALKAIDRQSLDVGYIDVRFQEPVIGPRPSKL